MTTIRKLEASDDLRGLIALSREFFAEYESHHPEFFKIDELRDQDVTDYFFRTIDVDDGATFIAVEDGRVIGYITVFVRPQPGYWHIKQVGAISGLMVHPGQRRKGIGRLLVAEAQAFFRDKGVAYYTVYTATANETAVRFYEQNGMEPLYVTLLAKDEP